MSEVLITDDNHKTIDIDGLKIDMSASIGDFFAKKIVAELTEKDFEKIYEYVISDIFFENREYKELKSLEEKRKFAEEFGRFGYVKGEGRVPSGYGYDRTEKYLPYYIKEKFNEKFKKDIIDKINEIIETPEYKERVDQIAKDILDYASEGWKNDAIERIRHAMIDDKLGSEYYHGISLRRIINEEICRMSNR